MLCVCIIISKFANEFTEKPLLSTSIIEEALRSGSFDGMPPDLWCEVQVKTDRCIVYTEVI